MASCGIIQPSNETFTLSGFSQGLPSNQMLALAFLKEVSQPPPITEVIGQLAHQLAQIPGIIPLLRPDPVLQISTGATKNNQGQYAFSISGVDATQVYQAAEQMIAKCRQFPGFAAVSSDYFANTPILGVNLNEQQLQSYGLYRFAANYLVRNPRSLSLYGRCAGET